MVDTLRCNITSYGQLNSSAIPLFVQQHAHANNKETSKFRNTGPCEGNSPVADGFP